MTQAMQKYDSYVICTSPRSGSTLLIKLLAATGVSGHPGSFFHQPSISRWLEYFELTPEVGASERDVLAEIVRAAIKKGSRDTGLFGLRLQRHSFDFFIEKLAILYPDQSTDRDRLEVAFGRTLFIHLTRPNKVDQAVSYIKAEQTGLWHVASDGTELERLAPQGVPVYNAKEIKCCYDRFTAFDKDWNHWFDAQQIEPLRITYDALSSDPGTILRNILDQLGLEPRTANDIEPGVTKMADKTNQDWVARFRQDNGLT